MSSKPAILLLVVAKGSPEDANSDNASKNAELVKQLSDDGYDVTLISLHDDQESDIKIKKALVEKTYKLVLVGGGVRKVPAWHDRLKGLLADTTSGKAIMVEPTHPNEAAEEVRKALPLAQQL